MQQAIEAGQQEVRRYIEDTGINPQSNAGFSDFSDGIMDWNFAMKVYSPALTQSAQGYSYRGGQVSHWSVEGL